MSTQVRRFTPAFDDDRPASIEATGGGAYLRLGDTELDLTDTPDPSWVAGVLATQKAAA